MDFVQSQGGFHAMDSYLSRALQPYLRVRRGWGSYPTYIITSSNSMDSIQLAVLSYPYSLTLDGSLTWELQYSPLGVCVCVFFMSRNTGLLKWEGGIWLI